MNCFYHNDIQAVAQCKGGCGKYLCADCYNANGGSCPDCIKELAQFSKQIITEGKKAAKSDIICFFISGIIGFFFPALWWNMDRFNYHPHDFFIAAYIFASIGVTLKWALRTGNWFFGILALILAPYILVKDIIALNTPDEKS